GFPVFGETISETVGGLHLQGFLRMKSKPERWQYWCWWASVDLRLAAFKQPDYGIYHHSVEKNFRLRLDINTQIRKYTQKYNGVISMEETMKIVTKTLAAAALLLVATMHLAYAGSITVYTALESDEVSDYMKAAKQALPDVDIHVLRLSTGDLSARLIAEANNPHADVVWGQAVTDLMDPRIYDQLTPYEAKGEVELPAKFRDPDGRWFAATGYMAAFCINEPRLKAKGLPVPKSWEDLTDPAYK